MIKKIHVKTGDTVIVISGKNKFVSSDSGKKEKAIGKVIAVSPKEGKIIVEGVNIVSKHVKPRRQGDPGGIIKAESALYACKVMLYCSKCDAGRRSKSEINKEGQKLRKCVKCGTVL